MQNNWSGVAVPNPRWKKTRCSRGAHCPKANTAIRSIIYTKLVRSSFFMDVHSVFHVKMFLFTRVKICFYLQLFKRCFLTIVLKSFMFKTFKCFNKKFKVKNSVLTNLLPTNCPIKNCELQCCCWTFYFSEHTVQ